MKRIPPFAAMALLLAGCTSFKSFTAFEPATPADYTGPTANVADQVLVVSAQRLHVFEITQVDGRRLASSSMASTRAGQGSGMTLTPVALTNELPLRPTQLRLQAATQYASPMLAMSNASCRTFGEVRFTGNAPFPDGFLRDFIPWKEDAYFNSEQVLNLQQRLVDADYFELVSVAPALDEKKDGTVPIDILLNRDQRTVYTGEVYYSTDFGAGVRLGAARRWLNQKGHKADVQAEYSQRLQEAALHYGIPRPGREDRSYDFGIAYRDETTDVSRSRNFTLAASRSEKRWHGFTRTIGIKFLRGDSA
jgi:outer membrane protein assembly factor BamA